MPKFIKIWLFSALISVTVLGMWKGIEWYYTKDIEEVAPIVITAEDLAILYETDYPVAKTEYDGRIVIITGVVASKGDAGAYYTVNLEGNFYDIDLSFFNLTEIAKLSDINIGETITVRGKIEGLNLVYISITDCLIE